MFQYPLPASLQNLYEAHLADEKVRSTKEICILGGLLFAIFSPIDLLALPTSNAMLASLARGAIILLLLGLFPITSRPVFLRHYVAFTVATVVAMAFALEAIIYSVPPDHVLRDLYPFGLMLIVMGLYVFVLLPIAVVAMLGTFVVLQHGVVTLLTREVTSGSEILTLSITCFFVLSANILGGFGYVQRNRYMRESFLLRQSLIGDLERAEAEKVAHQFWSNHDLLTGLANRKHLQHRLAESIEAARRLGKIVAVLFIDLDGFKQINDSLGHAAGDEVLKTIGQRLEDCVRDADIVARLGGDEFVVVLELDANAADTATRVAASALAGIKQPITGIPAGSELSGSIGIALFPDDAREAGALLQVADARMYKCKGRGKGGAVCAA